MNITFLDRWRRRLAVSAQWSGSSKLRQAKLACLVGFVLTVAVAAFSTTPAPEIEWGVWTVGLRESWIGAEAGTNWERLHPGIRLWRPDTCHEWAISDDDVERKLGGEDAWKITGLLAGQFELETRLQAEHFGRWGSDIILVIVLHPSGGVLPEWAKDVVRRKGNLSADAPVTFADAQATGVKCKRVCFSGNLPDDLPPGRYRVHVELRDADGTVRESYQRRLVRSADGKNPLQSLTDVALVNKYMLRGKGLVGKQTQPIAWPPTVAWRMAHDEIVRRGRRMVPAIMKKLEEELNRDPGEPSLSADKSSASLDMVKILAEIDDPRAVPLLLQLLEGRNGKIKLSIREAARHAMQGLTRVSFVAHPDNPDGCTLLGEDALVIPWREWDPLPWQESKETRDQRLDVVATRYAKWLETEGRDSSTWLALAQRRARAALTGDDRLAYANAVSFLAPGRFGGGHDDRPEETLSTLARHLDSAGQATYQEQTRWFRLASAVASYGPPARPYVQTIIDRAPRRYGLSLIWDLEKVGGERFMAHLVSGLPTLRGQLTQLGLALDVKEWHISNDDARAALLAYRDCRWCIERWAGRTFADDEAIVAWWAKAQSHSQREWLEENLERTCAEADAGNAKAQFIIRQVLPELPYANDDKPFDRPWLHRPDPPYREQRPGPFRSEWLCANRPRLAYDERRSVFTCRP